MVVDTLRSQQQVGSHHHVVHLFGHAIVFDIPIPALILAAVGALVLIKSLVSWLTFLAETFLFRGLSLKAFGAKKGRWAVITGCTSGIGEEFAHQLAQAGFNTLLISRSLPSLNGVAAIIESKYKVKTKVIAVDLSQPGTEQDDALNKIEDFVKSVEVGVLVNNAGLSHHMPVPFAETTLTEMDSILQVNVLSLLHLTRLIVPHLPRPALILNIGSIGGTIPSPLLTTYSASKAFLSTFTACLATELAPKGIMVRLILPGFVVSKMSKIRRRSALVPTAKEFVATSLGGIGLARGAQGRLAESTPWWSHALLDYIVGSLGLGGWAVWYNGRLQRDIRKRALKKQEREKLKAQ